MLEIQGQSFKMTDFAKPLTNEVMETQRGDKIVNTYLEKDLQAALKDIAEYTRKRLGEGLIK